jgi:hypothetical protein
MPPGEYIFSVFGYSPAGKILFETEPLSLNYEKKLFVEMFLGSEGINYVVLENHIFDAVHRMR